MESSLTVEGLEIPASVYTLEGFRSWYAGLEARGTRGIRASFVGGRVYIEMTPQDYRSHEPVVDEINGELRRLSKEMNLGRYFMPPSWITYEPAGLSTEPDGFLILWPSFASRKIALDQPTELVGYPDMVLEVVSKTTRRKDLVDLAQAYARAGVSEYWTADARGEHIDFAIQLLGKDGRYVAQTVAADGFIASPLWRHAFRLESFVNPAAWPDYRLLSRSI